MPSSAERNPTFRALRHRNFRLYLGGMLVSIVGSWMQVTAQSWLMYRLTRSEWMLGLTIFCANIPMLFLGPYAGLLADRFPRRRIVLITQAIMMLQAVALAALTFTGAVQPWHILALSLLSGFANAFDVPGRQALYVHLVEKDDLLNAISLNSAMFNSARIAGPGLGGLLVASTGEGVCFAINAISFIAVIASLLAMRMENDGASRTQPGSRLRDGFEYVRARPALRTVLLTAGVISFSGAPTSALAPVFAEEVFGRGARGFGFLVSAMGVGAVLGTLSLARGRGILGLPRAVAAACVIMAVALFIYALSPSYWVTFAVMPSVGLATMRLNAGSQTLVQATVDNRLRGRVMGLYSTMFLGMFPVGNLAAGALASAFGVRWASALSACVAAAGALYFWRGLGPLDLWVQEKRS